MSSLETTRVAEKGGFLRLGSLRCSIEADRWAYAEMLASVFRTELSEGLPQPELADVRIHIRASTTVDTVEATDRLIVHRNGDSFRIETDPLTVHIDRVGPSHRVEIVVRDTDLRPDQLAYHFFIVTNRWLLLLDRIVLHAAAIRVANEVLLFCGPKGAGKSTISVALAAAGSVILAEDHILARQSQDRILVSGCNSAMRVTRKTEEHFLNGRIPPDAIADADKKEFSAQRLFEARPYEDFPVDRIYFNHVGSKIQALPIAKREALLRLMEHTRELQRFGGPADYVDFLDALSAISDRVPAFDLELSRHLADLRDLPAILR